MSEQEATLPPATGDESNSNENIGSRNQGGNAGNQNTGGGNNNRQGRSNNNQNHNLTYVSDHSKDWKGNYKDIGIVLGIKAEKLNKTCWIFFC